MRRRFFALIISTVILLSAHAQSPVSIGVTVLNDQNQPLPLASVELVKKADASLVKIQMTDSSGKTEFEAVKPGEYFCRISHSGFTTYSTPTVSVSDAKHDFAPIVLQPANGTLSNITVSAKKPFIEMQAGKTVVNLDASITNTGTTVMEALEKMPGITVDKDGNISLKGKANVMVMIDGKQTYLDNSQLATLLNGMSSSQVSQVEIMDQPSAKYDAAGNAGIINIKTKKNLQKGFNGTITTTYAQGVYPKNNNSIQLNYRSGKWNVFGIYSANFAANFTSVYALRTYYDNNGNAVSLLEQPSVFKGWGNTHNVRAGVDYALDNKTTIGVTFSGLSLNRTGSSANPAIWMNPRHVVDSTILTVSSNSNDWRNAGGNFNFKHAFSSSSELTADVDIIGYRMKNHQFFENRLATLGGYTESTRAYIPSDIHIMSAKADYTKNFKDIKLESGVKTSHITTDNLADYENLNNGTWVPDYGKSNHFLYTERIEAVYSDAEIKAGKWTVNGGLRFEGTSYDAHQLGNVIQKDSSFSRSYNSLFPTLFTTFAADSNNTFSFTAGRRIDRPAFQKLNPFVFIINKYTYQTGNPYFRPQYTWNVELSHVYKNILTTSVGYSITTDYFSQIFPSDSTGLIIYTEGNLGKLQQLTLTVSTQLSPTSWWSLTAEGVLTHKEMQGVIGTLLHSHITQANFNLNNQLRFKKGWSGEVTGFYVSRSQNDIQEFVDPAGQLSVGVAKTVLKSKGTVKASVRDIFYTQWMKGNTFFPHATEYFKVTRDSRIVTISFTYRFGKAFKTNKRSEGSAGEEIQRVGNG